MSVCVSPLVQATTLMTDESLSCPQCPKSFSSTKLLQQHQQMFHTDKAFICETCGKAFRFRSNLAEHRSVHTALKPYVCKFCGKSSRLKGNLTKHILKHHKKEQNEAIAKDDIIVKKTPKVVNKENGPTANGSAPTTSTTTAAVMTTSTPATNSNNHNNNNNSNNVVNNNLRTVKMEIEDPDYVATTVTKTTPVSVVSKVVTTTPSTPRARPAPKEIITTVTPAVVVPTITEEPCLLPKDSSTELDRSVLISLGFDFGSTLSLNRQQLQQAVQELKAEASASPDTGSHLPIHMTMSHGYPPPALATVVEEKPASDTSIIDGSLHNELRTIANAINELKAQQTAAPRVEQALTYIDTRVGKLEKSLETALNSIYTLVQLQTGMTGSVNRLREDSTKNFSDLKLRMEHSWSPRRISRRHSMRSYSDSRDRSRSPL